MLGVDILGVSGFSTLGGSNLCLGLSITFFFFEEDFDLLLLELLLDLLCFLAEIEGKTIFF